MAFINLLDIIYPIGSIYMTISETSPASLFGGTWSQITGMYYLRAYIDDPNSGGYTEPGQTGGSNFITTESLPSHKHTITTNGAHTHSMKYAVQLPTSGSVWTPKTQASDSVDGSTTGYMASAGSHTHTIGSTGGGKDTFPLITPFVFTDVLLSLWESVM